jgi:hypothetical protein
MKNVTRLSSLKGCSSSKIRSPDLGKISRCFSNAPPHKLSEEEHVSNSKCWKCGKRQNCCHLFCSGCGKIQPVGGSCCNYFKLLDMYTSVPPSPIFTLLLLIESHSFHPLRPVSFKVDEKSLEQNYKNIQKVTHPDRYSMASEVFFPFSFSSISPIPLPHHPRLQMEKNASTISASTINQAYQVCRVWFSQFLIPLFV